MILTGSEIENNYISKKIFIEPFNKSQLNPNSYDFRLGNRLLIYKNNLLDPKIIQETEEIILDEQGFVIEPERIYLGSTYETMGSNHFVPIIKGKSSVARQGLFIHITADLIDIGSINQWTLQLHSVQPVKIYPHMLIGQVTFWQPKGTIVLYDGKYKGSIGPVASKIYKDFKK